MKKYILAATGIAAGFLLGTSCVSMMDDAQDANIVQPITVSYKVAATTGFVPKGGTVEPDPDFPVAGLKAVFNNYSEGTQVEAIVDEDGIATAEGLVPGIYAITFSGSVEKDGETYYLNGTAQNVALSKNVSKAEAMADDAPTVNIRPAKAGNLCFSELYYCGATTPTGIYFRDQTYQIYNNGNTDFDISGLCFAQLNPYNPTANLPVWPDEDGDGNYVYAGLVWQIPTDQPYILKPGESIVIAQKAYNHGLEGTYPFDNSMAEWEAFAGKVENDTPAPNLPKIWQSSDIYLTMQWLAPVFGAAYCIFKAPDDVTIDADYYEQDGHWQTQVNKSTRYAKIPADYILDGVELLTYMTEIDCKRIPGFVDSGATAVEGTYVGKSVSRKVIDQREDGTPIYQDTNNSTEDFQINEHPAIRRNGEKMPSWNWTLSGN